MSASGRLLAVLCLLLCPAFAGAQMRIIPRTQLDTSALVKPDFVIATPLLEEDGPSFNCDFVIPNDTADTLVVSGVTTTCSCVETTYRIGPVAPGEEFTVHVTYHQKRHPGRHDRRIYVFTQGRKSPRYNLLLRTTVSESKL